ncbi:hypothetical protein [Actinomadura sp. HBU206391]|uniref:hypothetical protein n=1 Tax=Actinomadura sp. HBU206391 TaxID=2731692 RepID=UPI00164F044B|nr:hypothetical protein [Actinomadura sp. HBU206391]MBC6460186.1 hypothetical protein [Actinomadura sp. HBU206391]
MADAVPSAGYPIGAEILADLSEPAELDRLRRAMAVDSVPGAVCACAGDVRFEFLDEDGRHLTTVVFHHGVTLRWDGWDGDAVLADGRSLLHWLEEHGAPGPLRQFEEDERQRQQAGRQEAEWLSAMPAALEDLSGRMLALSRTGGDPSPDLLGELRDRLRQAIPEPVSRALTLFEWCGAGSGRCSGFPVHEIVPDLLLKDMPIVEIIAGLQDPRAEARHYAGAVRHLVGWRTRAKQKRDLDAIPAPLKARLLQEAQASGDQDKQARATRWLTPTPSCK